MKSEKIWLVVLLISAILAQFALENSFSFLGGKINLILVALVVLINLMDFSFVIIFAVIAGLILDIYSGLPFGLISLSLFLTALLGELLFVNFFTNFSFYSLLIMGFLAAVFYHLLFSLLVVGSYFVGLSDFLPKLTDFYGLLWQVLSAEVLMVLAYYLVNMLSKRFKPIFLR